MGLPMFVRNLLLTFFAVGSLVAQIAPSTSLVGNILDPRGGAVPSATLELTNTSTHIKRLAASDSQGRYLFRALPPGQYELSANADGFAPFRQEGITLNVDVPATVNIRLGLATVTGQVTVQADASMVDTESGTLRQVVSERYIDELPLNGRNAAALTFMAPGAVVGKGTDTASYATTSDTLAISVNGTFGNQVAYKLDGSSHQDSITNLNAAFPNPDALSQFSVQTNNFDAQYGGSGGAVVNIATKSGTNAIHGTLFEYLRNGDLNARNFFAPQQDALKRNQFGGSFGGPVLRDRLFYFGSFQGTTLANVTYGNTAFVAAGAQAQGNFGLKTIINPDTKTAFPNNTIPASMISPIATAILQHVPTSADPTGKLLYAQPQSTRNYQALAKVDYNRGNHQISGSYFEVKYTDQGWDGGKTLLNYRLGQDQTTRSFKIGDTWTISPRLLNSFNFAGLTLDSTQNRTAPFSLFDFGDIKATKPEARFQETAISVTGYSGWGTGSPQPPGNWRRDNFEISDILSWTLGGHFLHVGGNFVPYSRFDSKTGYQEEPLVTFTGIATNNGLADLLLGRVNTFTQTAGKAKFTRGKQGSAFVQDNWRVTSRLSLNIGLRWDPFFPWTDPVEGQVGGYIPGFRSTRFPNAPVGLAFAGDPGYPSGGIDNNTGNFAPRLGAAYKLFSGNHSTTIRGGWGIFYIQPFARLYNNFVQNAPFSPSVSLFGVSLADPYGSAGVPNPFPPFAPVHPTASATFIQPIQYQYFNPNWHIGHTSSFNVTLEQQLMRDLLLRAAYVGTRGKDLQYFAEANPAIYSTAATTSNTNNRRALYPTFASLIQLTNGGYSNYNALQITLERRVSSKCAFVANYTFSKSLDNESVEAQFTLSDPNPFNPKFNYGLSEFDTKHNFSMWALYDMPALANAPKLLRAAFGGWKSTGIWSQRSGVPINVTSGQDRSYSGVGLDRADLIGNPFQASGRSRADTIAGYFSTAAFALNAPGTFGNSPRNPLRGPGFVNLDWSLAKSFRIRERLRFETRADFFNLFDTPHFNAPGSSFSSASTFGKISSAGDPRIVQISMRLRF